MYKTLSQLVTCLTLSALPLCAATTGDQDAISIDDQTVSTPAPDSIPAQVALPEKITKKNPVSRLEMKAMDEATLNALKESAAKLTDPHHKIIAEILIAHLDRVVAAYDQYTDEDNKWTTMLHGMVTQCARKLNSLFKGEKSYIDKMNRKAEKEAKKAEKEAAHANPPAAPEKGVVEKIKEGVTAAATAVVDAVKPAAPAANAEHGAHTAQADTSAPAQPVGTDVAAPAAEATPTEAGAPPAGEQGENAAAPAEAPAA